ncbi:zinc finger CCCH domain-containing protein 43-like [Humulus lupulus]|uniref:zinc finger CCCH domain-containing protein 43-like n=1 Tax=Humulus lupulus TaxID=3486 RepID=UPI002B411FA1|nr:zinc finger CCCH domain-containing protein 43-like [Humulus lupulus]
MMLSPTQGVPSQNPEWNGYQDTLGYMMNNLVTETNMYQHHPPQKLIEEYPERPGQPKYPFPL